MTENINTIQELLKIQIIEFSKLQKGTVAYAENEKKLYNKNKYLIDTFSKLSEVEASHLFLILFEKGYPNLKLFNLFSDRFSRVEEPLLSNILKILIARMAISDRTVVNWAFLDTYPTHIRTKLSTNFTTTAPHPYYYIFQSDEPNSMGNDPASQLILSPIRIQYKYLLYSHWGWKELLNRYLPNPERKKSLLIWMNKTSRNENISATPEISSIPEKKELLKPDGKREIIDVSSIIHGHFVHKDYFDNYENWSRIYFPRLERNTDPISNFKDDARLYEFVIEFRDGKKEFRVKYDDIPIPGRFIKPKWAHRDFDVGPGTKFENWGNPEGIILRDLIVSINTSQDSAFPFRRSQLIHHFEQRSDGLIIPYSRSEIDGKQFISYNSMAAPNIIWFKYIAVATILSGRNVLAYMSAGMQFAGAIAGLAGLHTPVPVSSRMTKSIPTLSAQRATTPSSRLTDTPKPQSTGESQLNTTDRGKPGTTVTATQHRTTRHTPSGPEVQLKRSAGSHSDNLTQQKIREAEKSQERATAKHQNLNEKRQTKTTSVSEREIAPGVRRRTTKLSGWKEIPERPSKAKPEDVAHHSKKIGHELTPNKLKDNERSGGFKGKFNASHAEKQQIVDRPNEPVGVSRDMCSDCISFFKKEAKYRNQFQIVSDPKITRVFDPDGTIIEYWKSGGGQVIGSDGKVIGGIPNT